MTKIILHKLENKVQAKKDKKLWISRNKSKSKFKDGVLNLNKNFVRNLNKNTNKKN
jgi:hypothetical protein